MRLIFGFTATPQLFLHTRRLPVSPDVNISDIRKITFLSAIDSLLTVVRCNDPTHVFTMHEINRQWWFRSSHRCQIVRTSSTGGLIGHRRAPKLLRKRGKATLSTLIAEFKTRATSWGIFPLSLLDAAAYQLILRRWSKGHMAFNLASLWDRTLQYAIPDIQLQPPQ